MPTADRPRFVELAVRLFLRQTYRAKELVVVDDGACPIGSVLPALPTIRYCRLAERLPLGEKRNLACDLAEGSS